MRTTLATGLLITVLAPAATAAATPLPTPRAGLLIYHQAVCPPGIASDPDVGQRLPEAGVDTTVAASGARVRPVPAGGDLQAALDTAQPGDVITLAPGATYVGPFRLPKLADSSDWVEIRPATIAPDFPTSGNRVTPGDADAMPRLVAAHGTSVVSAAKGASHYRLVGLEITPSPGAKPTTLVELGGQLPSAADLPHHIVIDRSYLHAAGPGIRRGVALNGRDLAVVDSWLAGFRQRGADSQAIAGWNGPGPFAINNNHLSAASENVMFGGADPAIDNLTPSDIEICFNHFTKPASWRRLDGMNVKNLFELKHASRVLVAGNLFEQVWADAQVGFAMIVKSTNQDDTAPWTVLSDVTIRYNLIQRAGSGIAVEGREPGHRSRHARRLVIADNVLRDIGVKPWRGDGRLFQVSSPGPTSDLKIDHNTAPVAGNAFLAIGDRGVVARRFWVTNNLVGRGDYGVKGGGTDEGTPSLRRYADPVAFDHNAIIGAPRRAYPPDNLFPVTVADVGFVDYSGFDWALAAGSPFAGAGSDGRDLGADIATLMPLVQRARSGVAP